MNQNILCRPNKPSKICDAKKLLEMVVEHKQEPASWFVVAERRKKWGIGDRSVTESCHPDSEDRGW
jgi:hypothetical protein